MICKRKFHINILDLVFFILTLAVYKIINSVDKGIFIVLFMGGVAGLNVLRKIAKSPVKIESRRSEIGLSYILRKDKLLPHKDIEEVVFKNHSTHTCYVEIKYKDQNQNIDSIEFFSRDYSNLRLFVEELHIYTQNKETFSTVILKKLVEKEDDEKISGLLLDGPPNKEITIREKMKKMICWRYVKRLIFVIMGICFTFYALFDLSKIEYFILIFSLVLKVSLIVYGLYIITYIVLKPFKYSKREIGDVFGRYTGIIFIIILSMLEHYNIIKHIDFFSY